MMKSKPSTARFAMSFAGRPEERWRFLRAYATDQVCLSCPPWGGRTLMSLFSKRPRTEERIRGPRGMTLRAERVPA